MTTRAGLWIDHRKAVVVMVSGEGDSTQLKARLEHDGLGARVLDVETVDKMTDRQIAAKVRERF